LQEDTPPPRSPGSVTPDLTTGLGSRALRFTILILVARILSRLLALVAVVVAVDLLFFRDHAWERLAANVGIVLVFGAFYVRFLNRS